MKQPKNYSLIEMQRDGIKLKFMRKRMGITQTFFCKKFNINQANYSRMEKGQSYAGKALFCMVSLFVDWRKKEIERLNDEIYLLENFKIN